MQKSNLGISVGVVGAAAYLLSMFAGYEATLLLVGYVLLFENNGWLKRTALKAMVITVLFSLAGLAIEFIPDCVSLIHSFVAMFDGKFKAEIVYEIQSVLLQTLSITKVVVMTALAMKALGQSTIVIGFIDKLVNKCVE